MILLVVNFIPTSNKLAWKQNCKRNYNLKIKKQIHSKVQCRSTARYYTEVELVLIPYGFSKPLLRKTRLQQKQYTKPCDIIRGWKEEAVMCGCKDDGDEKVS